MLQIILKTLQIAHIKENNTQPLDLAPFGIKIFIK